MSRIFLDSFNRISSSLILSAIFFLLAGAGLGRNSALCQDNPNNKVKVTAAEIKKLIEEKADDKVLLPILKNAFRNGSRRAVQVAADASFELKQRALPLVPAMVQHLKANPTSLSYSEILECFSEFGTNGTAEAIPVFIEIIERLPKNRGSFEENYEEALINIGYNNALVADRFFKRLVTDDDWGFTIYNDAGRRFAQILFDRGLKSKNQKVIRRVVEQFLGEYELQLNGRLLLLALENADQETQVKLAEKLLDFPLFEGEVIPYFIEFIKSDDTEIRESALGFNFDDFYERQVIQAALEVVSDDGIEVKTRCQIIDAFAWNYASPPLTKKQIDIFRTMLESEHLEIRQRAAIYLAEEVQEYHADLILSVLNGLNSELIESAISVMRFDKKMAADVAEKFHHKLVELFDVKNRFRYSDCTHALASYPFTDEIAELCKTHLGQYDHADRDYRRRPERVISYLMSVGKLPTEIKDDVLKYLNATAATIRRTPSEFKTFFSNDELLALAIDKSIPRENRRCCMSAMWYTDLDVSQKQSFVNLLQDKSVAKFVAFTLANNRVVTPESKPFLKKLVESEFEDFVIKDSELKAMLNTLGNRGKFLTKGIEAWLESADRRQFEMAWDLVRCCDPRNEKALSALFRCMRRFIQLSTRFEFRFQGYRGIEKPFNQELLGFLESTDTKLIKYACDQLEYQSEGIADQLTAEHVVELEKLFKHENAEIQRLAKYILESRTNQKKVDFQQVKTAFAQLLASKEADNDDIQDVLTKVELLGEKGAPLIEAILQLHQEHNWIEDDIIEIFKEMGPKAVAAKPFLSQMLEGKNAYDAAEALLAIGGLNKAEAQISMHLSGREGYPPWFFRSWEDYLEINEPIDGVLQAISSNLKQKKDLRASLGFVEALGKRAKPISAELINTLSHGEVETQIWAARAIGSMISEEDRIGEKELVQILRANTDASWAAAETLSKIQSPDAYPVLLSEIQKPDGIYLCNAILNYESKYKEYSKILLSAFGGEDPISSRSVFDALNRSNVGRQRLRDRLIELIVSNESNPMVSELWIGWLGDMGEFAKPVLPTLEKIMADCPASTRFAIENAIRKIDPKRAAELGF